MPKLAVQITAALVISMLLASPCFAYIGPGAGISVVGSLLGILATIFVAIGAIIFWPIRKYRKRRKARLESGQGGAPEDSGQAD